MSVRVPHRTGTHPRALRFRTSVSRARTSPGVLSIAWVLAGLLFLNFANYTVLAPVLQPPAARSVLLVLFSLILFYSSGDSFARFHLRRSWDVYLVCAMAFLSAAYASEPLEILKYALWLTLSVYVGTELAARIRNANDLVIALTIVLLPTLVFVAVVNMAMGPIVISTGREFGALGSRHVATAYAMVFICLFLALRVVPVETAPLQGWMRLAMWGILPWAAWQVVFGLTRSVWLGAALTLFLYWLRHSLSLPRLVGTLFLFALLAVTMVYLGVDRVVPGAIQGRIEVTEQRYDSGHIDPRITLMHLAYQYALDYPQGRGYGSPGPEAHNSYVNMLLDLGWVGFFLTFFALSRSVAAIYRLGLPWSLFFAIGGGALLLHAFFETENLPGQATFIPLLVWYALSRSRFLEELTKRAQYSTVTPRSLTRPP